MNKQQQIILLIGLWLCVACVLFPPRKLVDVKDNGVVLETASETVHFRFSVPHAFIFASDFGLYTDTAQVGYRNPTQANTCFVAIDSATLLAELVLLGSLTLIVCITVSLLSRKEVVDHTA